MLNAVLSGPSLRVADAVTVLTAALGCGLLIGIERERRKGTGPSRALAGVRSFALVSVLGAAAMLMNEPWLVAVGAAFVAALGVVGYARDKSGDPGTTTEIALLLTYLIGALCTWSLALAAGMAVGLTALLAGRERMHQVARDWLRPAEVRDGIVLASLALIALPLMPNRPFWGPVLNPHLITQLLALLLAIQALAHLSRRLLQARQAIALSALASGFVSSSATIVSLGLEVREGRAQAGPMAGAALLSCVATMLQLLVVAAAMQPSWLRLMWLPCLAGASLAAVWGGWMVAALPSPVATTSEGGAVPDDGRMFSLRRAALVAMLLTGIQVLVYALQLGFGDTGLLAGALLGAVADLHAASAAVLVQGGPEGARATPLREALMAALLLHGASKTIAAWISGGGGYALRLAPGLLAQSVVSAAGIAWLAGDF